MQPTCDGMVYVPEDVAPPDHAGWWMWLGITIAVIGIDLWLHFHHKDTLSEKLRNRARKHPWFRAFGIGLFSYLIWHFFLT